MKKNNINKINIFDNEDIDLEKVANRVIEIFKEINSKRAAQNLEGNGEKNMKKAMTVLSYLFRKYSIRFKDSGR